MPDLTKLLILATFAVLVGCNDRFDGGYRTGFADGLREGEKAEAEKAAAAERERRRRESLATARSVTTEVCGGGGVNFNGKHIRPGKTGCVRVFNDGTVQRY